MPVYSGTPRTWAAGEIVTAALMNSDVRDPLSALAGAWNSYTPAITGFTLGNGTVSGRYLQVGKLIIFVADFTFGSTSVAGTSLNFSLPVASNGATNGPLFRGVFVKNAGSTYTGHVIYSSTTVAALTVLGTNGISTATSATVPFTWAASDKAALSGIYEAA